MSLENIIRVKTHKLYRLQAIDKMYSYRLLQNVATSLEEVINNL